MSTSQATSVSTLWDALYNWVTGVLTGVEVVEAYQNAPSPTGNYIAIDYSGTWRRAGTTPDNKDGGVVNGVYVGPRVYTYRGSVLVRDVEGDGENLLRLVESLDADAVREAMASAGFSVLSTSGPVELPSIEQSTWRRESVLTLEMSWARGYAGETLTMLSVEITQENAPVSEPAQTYEKLTGPNENPLHITTKLNRFTTA